MSESHIEKAQFARDVLSSLGSKFVEEYRANRKTAWNNFMFGLMLNLDTLASSDLIANLRDLIAICRDIDEKVGSGEQGKSATGEPLDVVSERWVKKDGKPSPKHNDSD